MKKILFLLLLISLIAASVSFSATHTLSSYVVQDDPALITSIDVWINPNASAGLDGDEVIFVSGLDKNEATYYSLSPTDLTGDELYFIRTTYIGGFTIDSAQITATGLMGTVLNILLTHPQ